MAKTIKPIVRFDSRAFVFDSIAAAADAIKFFGKLRPVKFTPNPDGSGYHYAPMEDGMEIELETNREFCATPKRLALPAPKRGTVPCSNCESVSVRPGRPCASCGTVAPTDH
jgi:hypothetical protein